MPLLHRRLLLVPTWRGWLLFLILGAGLIIGFGRTVHPFLAVNHPVMGEVLVIEGWLSDYAIDAGAEVFKRGQYHRVYVTGSPLERATHMAGFDSYAAAGVAVLVAAGLAPDVVVPVPSNERYRNRTYATALALRDYCASSGIELTSIDVVTSGTHARRSRLCYRRALGGEVEVGVIAVSSRDYDDARWWRYSQGVKAVLSELIALSYAWMGVDYGK